MPTNDLSSSLPGVNTSIKFCEDNATCIYTYLCEGYGRRYDQITLQWKFNENDAVDAFVRGLDDIGTVRTNDLIPGYELFSNITSNDTVNCTYPHFASLLTVRAFDTSNQQSFSVTCVFNTNSTTTPCNKTSYHDIKGISLLEIRMTQRVPRACACWSSMHVCVNNYTNSMRLKTRAYTV